MMSMKCKYAFKALIRLGKSYKEGPMQTGEIASSENIPRKFLEAILLDLKRAGFVNSKQGSRGGYYLKLHPRKINVADVHRLFDGAIALLPCVAVQYYERCDDCRSEKTCELRGEFLKIKERTRQIMKRTTIESFLVNSRVKAAKKGS